MKRLLFKDLIYANNGMVFDASEIKSLALKQISRGRFEIEGNEFISKILYLKEEM